MIHLSVRRFHETIYGVEHDAASLCLLADEQERPIAEIW